MISIFSFLPAALLLALPNSDFFSQNMFPTAAATTAKLEGMPYPKARKIILGYGWVPFKGGCLQNERPEICAQFPELINCTQGQPEFCILRFTKPGRCLEITTRGGYLEDNGGISVDQVAFLNKKCRSSF